jgi:hypothetical protein
MSQFSVKREALEAMGDADPGLEECVDQELIPNPVSPLAGGRQAADLLPGQVGTILKACGSSALRRMRDPLCIANWTKVYLVQPYCWWPAAVKLRMQGRGRGVRRKLDKRASFVDLTI